MMDVKEQKKDGKRKMQEWLLMATMVSSYLLCAMGNSCINPYFPEVAVKIGMSSSLMSFILCVVYIPQLLLMFYNAKLMLRFGSTNIFKIGMLLSGLSAIAFGYTYLIGSLTWFTVACIALKLVNGVGYSLILNSSFFIATKEMPEKVSFAIIGQTINSALTSRNSNMSNSKVEAKVKHTKNGLLEAGTGLGNTLGPLEGGFLYDNVGYAMPLLVTGIPQLVIFALSFITLRGISNTSTEEPEYKNADDKTKLKKILPAFVVQLVIAGTYTLILCNYDITIPLYGGMVLKDTPSDIGMVLGIAGFIYCIAAVLVGLLADKKGKELWIMGFGLGGNIAVFIVMICVKVFHGKLELAIFGTLFTVLGIFSTCMYIPNASLITKILKAHDIPITEELNSFVSTSIMASFIIGQLIGTGASGIFYQYLGISNSGILFTCVLCIQCVLLITVVRPKLKERPTTESRINIMTIGTYKLTDES